MVVLVNGVLKRSILFSVNSIPEEKQRLVCEHLDEHLVGRRVDSMCWNSPQSHSSHDMVFCLLKRIQFGFGYLFTGNELMYSRRTTTSSLLFRSWRASFAASVHHGSTQALLQRNVGHQVGHCLQFDEKMWCMFGGPPSIRFNCLVRNQISLSSRSGEKASTLSYASESKEFGLLFFAAEHPCVSTWQWRTECLQP